MKLLLDIPTAPSRSRVADTRGGGAVDASTQLGIGFDALLQLAERPSVRPPQPTRDAVARTDARSRTADKPAKNDDGRQQSNSTDTSAATTDKPVGDGINKPDQQKDDADTQSKLNSDASDADAGFTSPSDEDAELTAEQLVASLLEQTQASLQSRDDVSLAAGAPTGLTTQAFKTAADASLRSNAAQPASASPAPQADAAALIADAALFEQSQTSSDSSDNSETPDGQPRQTASTSASHSLQAVTQYGDAVAGVDASSLTPDASATDRGGRDVSGPSSVSRLDTSSVDAGRENAGDEEAVNGARLARGLRAAVNQQGGSVTLRLTPPEMGTVRIQLDLSGGTVTARFHAETDNGRQLLQQQLGQLRQSLESQGLSVDRLSVQTMSSSNSNTGFNQDAQQDQAGNDGRSRGQFFNQGGSSQRGRDDGNNANNPQSQGFSNFFNTAGVDQ